jgi:hypothetical protein
MVDGSKRVEFADVEVVWSDDVAATCRVGERIVAVAWRRMLPGSELSQAGDSRRRRSPSAARRARCTG